MKIDFLGAGLNPHPGNHPRLEQIEAMIVLATI
jgi:hypothetical protein